MKLARISHIRCHERSLDEPTTYVWVPDEMTKEQLDSLIDAAVKDYDDAGKEFEAAEKPPYVSSWGMADYRKYPDKTVREVDEILERERADYTRWKQLKSEAQKDFAYHLRNVSGETIVLFHSLKPAIGTEVDWGHRHGKIICFGETKGLDRDVHGTVKRDEF